MPYFTSLLIRWRSRSVLASFESKQKICRRSCTSSSASPTRIFQTTLSSTISRSGLGLHTGMLVGFILVLSRPWSCSKLFLFLLGCFVIVGVWYLCPFRGLILNDDFKNHLWQESDLLWSSFQLLLVKAATLSMFLIMRGEIQKKTMKKLMKGKRKRFLLPYANVEDTTLCTTLSSGKVKIRTVEHVISALEGLGVDNCRMELKGGNEVMLEKSMFFSVICVIGNLLWISSCFRRKTTSTITKLSNSLSLRCLYFKIRYI